MNYPYYKAETLDDLMHEVIKEILVHGKKTKNKKGNATELIGVLLQLGNPRSRLSRTETRGRMFSCIGELCWYLAKSDEVSFIKYYLSEYEKFADGDIVHGAYGPRLFRWREMDQVKNIISLLKRRPHSRQAVIQLFDAQDLTGEHKDVPCTCTLQFFLREGKLLLVTNMRSNDVYWGLPHDLFAFTMLQEIVARSLDADIGIYKHVVGSIHLYDDKRELAEQFLNEGLQTTKLYMPKMPNGDPWPSIEVLLRAESSLRKSILFDLESLGPIEPYWKDLILLLLIFQAKKKKDIGKIEVLSGKLSSPIYNTYIGIS